MWQIYLVGIILRKLKSYVPLHAYISVLEYVLVTEIIVNHITSRNNLRCFFLWKEPDITR